MSKNSTPSFRAKSKRMVSSSLLMAATSAFSLLLIQDAQAADHNHIASLQINNFAERTSVMQLIASDNAIEEPSRNTFAELESNYDSILVPQNVESFDLAEMNLPFRSVSDRKPHLVDVSFDSAQLQRREFTEFVLRSFPEQIAYVMPESHQTAITQLPEVMEPQVVVEGKTDRVTWDDVKIYEYAFQALNIVDTIQTVGLLSKSGHHEENPILGKDPSPIVVVGYKAMGGLIHYGMTKFLLSKSPEHAKIFQQLSLAVQGGVVAWNMQFVF